MKHKSCDQPCGPGDFYEGGYCDLHGCFKSLSDQFRERLEKEFNKFRDIPKYGIVVPEMVDRLKLKIMDAYNEVHKT